MNYRAFFLGCLAVAQLAGVGSVVACGGENGAPLDGDVADGVGAPGASGAGPGGGGQGGGGQGGGGNGGVDYCALLTTVTVRGSGFSEYEGFRVIGKQRATQLCSDGVGSAVIAEGAFSLSITAPSGAGDASLFIDFNGNGQADDDEPDWYNFEGDLQAGYAWAVTPADFERVRHLRARAAGLPAAYEGRLLEYAFCEGPQFDPLRCRRGVAAVIEGGAFDTSLSYDSTAHHGLYLWLDDGDHELDSGEPAFRDTLPLPSRCAVASVATSCDLEAADFAPAP